ncbi:uncharacterized protein cubi_03222 [Cryptosporidium ubiquitum]|uniref:Uncharacterized protein n=1 Tax=Cryptosporidium ubiquitum TaxID=857276 RepID=A0A1J4MM04_9CRYT|nr:uncharacterized protein cubi_03222 [Cryptosporidium ubiquitum]OII75206.1 hypothetical protein cubi_03222 [Cryptosporidium ubiquitum]
MFLKLLYKINKYLATYIIFILFLRKIENKNREVFINSNLSLIKVLNSFENLETDKIEKQIDLELEIDMGESTNSDIFNHDNSKHSSNDLEAYLKADNNSTSEKLNVIPVIELDFGKRDSVSVDEKSETEVEPLNDNQVEFESCELVNPDNVGKLENEIAALMKNEKKLVRKLEQIEFTVNIYSKAFLSDSSMSNTIKFIKKYELVKKNYQKNCELLEKKKSDLEKYK